MKIRKYIIVGFVAFFALLSFNIEAKDKAAAKMYVFGVATSFNDSTAYFTPVQELDSVTVVGKTGLLANKQEYSYQLKSYFNGIGLPYRTCVTVNSTNRKTIIKRFMKLRQKMIKKGNYDIKNIDTDAFKFERVVMAQ